MSSTTSLASSLFHLDAVLAPLNQKATSRQVGPPSTGATVAQENFNHAKIVGDVQKFLDDLKGLYNNLDGRSVAKVIQKIEANLQKFVNENPSSELHYRNLLVELSNRANEFIQSFSASPIVGNSSTVSTTQNQSPFAEEYYSQKHFNFEDVLTALAVKEKQCLAFCVAFFSQVTNAVIKKRDLIQWWIGIDLVDESSECEEILKKLVAEELILQSVLIKTTPSSWYTMQKSVVNKLKENGSLQVFAYEAVEKNRHFIVYHQKMEQVSEVLRIAASINIKAYTLNVETFEWLFLMKNIKVLHIGSWCYGMDYVVVEDIMIRFLKALKNLKQVRLLSLQGVSRIEELPDSIYKMSKLRVLDLRGCEDLRLLPKGLGSLKQLTHLDLSKCYQLVLIKGFTINTEGSSCGFDELSKLKQLRKLSIRTRRMNFPTNQDVKTLLNMQELRKLKISWVNRRKGDQPEGDKLTNFVMTLKKLELQAAPENTSSRLLSLISHRRDNCLEKLYISGGGLVEMDASMYYFFNVEVVRLRHLHHLHVKWSDFRHQFPSLTKVEIFGCPNLLFFPCDQNGLWDKSES